MSTRFSQKLQDFDVSFDEKGNLTERNYTSGGLITTKKNYFFHDKIEYVRSTTTYSGRAKFIFKSLITGAKYYMFLSDLDDILQEGVLKHKIIEGFFSFKKRNVKQGIRFVRS